MGARPTLQASEPAKKPVRLELNNSGAWKLVCRFDAAREDQADAAMEGAEQLLRAAGGRGAWRISSDEPLPAVLMRLDDVGQGWRAASGHGED